MIKISVVCFAILACTGGVKRKKCVVEPIEFNWPDRNRVCHERIWPGHPDICDLPIEPYNHDVIEAALEADTELKAYLNDVIRIYYPNIPHPVVDQCPVDSGDPLAPQIVNCERICPSSYVNVTTVAYEYESNRWTKCHVVRPWEQLVYYMQCGTRTPLVEGMDDSFQCVPENVIRRRIVIYCPKLPTQCRKMDIDLPTHCAASKFTCITKESPISARVNSLLSGFFI